MNIEIKRAQPEHVGAVAVLFDRYRQFYDQPPDLPACTDYIRDRLANSESVIFTAFDRGAGKAVGFTQLYPTFCSVAAARIFVLYDLFVAAQARRNGVGGMLMRAAECHAREAGAARINLETHHTNLKAQRLYESLNYRKDHEFYGYALEL